VPDFAPQTIRCAVIALWTLSCAAGCNLVDAARGPIVSERNSPSTHQPDVPGGNQLPSNARSQSKAAPKSLSRQRDDSPPDAADEIIAALAAGDHEWVERTPTASDDSTKAEPLDHWRHTGLETVLARDDARARLRAALRSRDAIVAANAAIGLASYNELKILPRLMQTARTSTFKLPMRGAAIEAIGRLNTPAADETIDELIREFGDFSGAAQARYLPELHADLVRAIARRPVGRHEQSLQDALKSPAVAVRLQAAQVFPLREGPCPPELVDLTVDKAASVRAMALRALVHARHEAAQTCAERGLTDYDLSVRLAAVEALGNLPAAQNGASLNQLAASSTDFVRAAAVAALATRRDFAAVEHAVSDKSWRVRRAVAESLEKLPPVERRRLAQELLNDPSSEVQRSMVRSLTNWPTSEAVPLLLVALEGRTAATQIDAAAQLRSRWPAAGSLMVALPQRFAAEADRLRQVWEQESAGDSNIQADDAELENSPQRAEAEVDPQTLERLGDDSVHERRSTVRMLLKKHRDQLLPEAALARIGELMEREPDGLVWADVLLLIASDSREGAFELAAAAASHSSAEVRRRACNYFGQHASPRAVEVLVNSLSDDDVTVIREAVRALGHQREISDLTPFETLLTSTDDTLRIEAAEALAWRGAPSGMPALLRATYHRDPTIRRQAAAALGNVLASAQRRALPDAQKQEAIAELQRLLSDRGEVRRAAQLSLKQIAKP